MTCRTMNSIQELTPSGYKDKPLISFTQYAQRKICINELFSIPQTKSVLISEIRGSKLPQAVPAFIRVVSCDLVAPTFATGKKNPATGGISIIYLACIRP